jgi:hypothetical protein
MDIRIRLFLLKGVCRRFFLYFFARGYVEKSLEARKGKCERCGICCHLFMSKCVYLKFDENGKTSCSIYKKVRMPNCKIFPLNDKDIKDRDLLSKLPCGFCFPKENEREYPKRDFNN